jgi:hypothetical protein
MSTLSRYQRLTHIERIIADLCEAESLSVYQIGGDSLAYAVTFQNDGHVGEERILNITQLADRILDDLESGAL